jgi:hypothetical protein
LGLGVLGVTLMAVVVGGEEGGGNGLVKGEGELLLIVEEGPYIFSNDSFTFVGCCSCINGGGGGGGCLKPELLPANGSGYGKD